MSLSRRQFVVATAVTVPGLAAVGAAPAVDGRPEPGIRIPVTATDDGAALTAKAARVRPTERQIAWQRLERTAFVHFGMNTFTGLEHGTGEEEPEAFLPTALDTDQWARALRDGGFKLAILTVKHHDGFLLYPSRYSRHSVASSPWQDGRGNVLRSFADSMRRHGIKVGVYLSPADENQLLTGVYANGSARSARTIPGLVEDDDRTPAPSRTFTMEATDYGEVMLNQLYEVLTEYGPIHEVWFDGAEAHLPPDRTERYDWDSWFALIRALAPQAVIASTGPDVRWVGNENGFAREDEWSVVPAKDSGQGLAEVTPTHQVPDMGSRSALTKARATTAHLQWWPAECDVSLRNGWFHREGQTLKPVDELTDCYFRSVGRNGVLLVNVPPDRRGLFADTDVARLREFQERLAREMPVDLARGARVRDAGTRLDLARPVEVDRIRLAEDIRHGQQIEAAVVEARTSRGWTEVARTGTVGASRILLLPKPVRARSWRVRVLRSRSRVRLSRFGLYRSRV
ncbi:alpha-L-fucosidase [Streptomyces sp. NBC_01304]|uniref:alpha-L-fucosidase n=1 Tax=Streptomyces sp. NBC_01304 TaxID=2903818 RepID=UPI002E1522A7|nr:alpha-L-fucosidase [Streptomyces sp. NBC_01304]